MSANHILNRAEEAAALLGILGNAKRLMIMCHLLDEEMSVGQIAEAVDLSQSALSQHLAKLRQMGVVKTRRDKQTIYYSCSSDHVRELMDTMDRFYVGNDKMKMQREHLAS